MKKQKESSQVEAEAQVIATVKEQLKSAIIKIIQTTVSSSGVSLEDPNSLVTRIIQQLCPVVFQAVHTALRMSSYTFNAEALMAR